MLYNQLDMQKTNNEKNPSLSQIKAFLHRRSETSPTSQLVGSNKLHLCFGAEPQKADPPLIKDESEGRKSLHGPNPGNTPQ